MTFRREVHLGGRELLDTISLLIPAGEIARIDVVLDEMYTGHPNGATLRFDVEFQETLDGQSVEFKRDGDRARMILKNWSSPGGTALKEPFQMAVTELGTVQMVMMNQPIGGTNALTIQLWWNEGI